MTPEDFSALDRYYRGPWARQSKPADRLLKEGPRALGGRAGAIVGVGPSASKGGIYSESGLAVRLATAGHLSPSLRLKR